MRLEMKPMADTQREMLARIDILTAAVFALARAVAAANPAAAEAMTRDMKGLIDRTGLGSYATYLHQHLRDAFDAAQLPVPPELRRPH